MVHSGPGMGSAEVEDYCFEHSPRVCIFCGELGVKRGLSIYQICWFACGSNFDGQWVLGWRGGRAGGRVGTIPLISDGVFKKPQHGE